MAQLSVVKSLSRLQEERQYVEEILLDHIGLSLARGTIVEIAGENSSGRTSLALSLLAKLTAEGEICALVDAFNGFDPCSAVSAGVTLENLLWLRCGGEIEKAFMSTDHLVQAKGFGAIWLDLSRIPEQKLRLVPKTYWYRYRTRIKGTPTLLIVTTPQTLAGSAAQRSFLFTRGRTLWSGSGSFKLLREFHISLTSRKHFSGDEFRTKIEVDYTDV